MLNTSVVISVFTKHAKNDPPREGKKLVFLRFLG